MAQGGAPETPQCPEPNLLAAYYERALPAGESERLEGHLADCPRCQLMLATIARADPGVAATPSFGLSRWFTGWRIAVPALAAAVVVVVVMQGMRPREAAVDRQQIALLEKNVETDKLAAMPAQPAAPAPSSIGALAMSEPKRVPEEASLGGEVRREASAKTDTVARAEPLAKENAAQAYSGAASGRADVAGAPAPASAPAAGAGSAAASAADSATPKGVARSTFPRQAGAIGEATAGGDAFRRAMQFFKPCENRGLMLKSLVANELQRCINRFFRFDASEPQRRLMGAAEEVVEARG
jgi:hypothetical protein